jgi:hypothetical protein
MILAGERTLTSVRFMCIRVPVLSGVAVSDKTRSRIIAAGGFLPLPGSDLVRWSIEPMAEPPQGHVIGKK